MCLFFGSHAVGLAFLRVVEAGFLRDSAATFDNFDLPLDLVFQRFADKAKRINVLDFRFRAEFFLPARPHAHVSIAAKRTFFHIAVADAGVQNDFF